MNLEKQEIVEDSEQKCRLGALSNEGTSFASSNNEAAHFSNTTSLCDKEIQLEYNIQRESETEEDMLTKFDKSGRELQPKNKRKTPLTDKTLGGEELRPIKPPNFFTSALKNKPDSILAMVTDTHLSVNEVHLIKSDILSEIDKIPLRGPCPQIINSSFFNIYLVLKCKDDFTKTWVMNKYKGNKNVIKGKTLIVLNATELPDTFYIRNPNLESRPESFKRLKFINTDWESSNNSGSNKNLSFDTLKEIQTPCHSNAEPAPSGCEKTNCFIKEEATGFIDQVSRSSCSDEDDKIIKETVQARELNTKKQKIQNLLRWYEQELKSLRKGLGQTSSTGDAQAKLTEKYDKLTKKYKELKEVYNELEIKGKIEKSRRKKAKRKEAKIKKKKLSLVSNSSQASNLNETFSFSNRNHIRQIMRHCIITDSTKKWQKEEKQEIMRECIEKLRHFRVKFMIRDTNMYDTKQLLCRLNRFKPHLKCTNWHVLSKYVDFRSVKWIFLLKPYEVENIRKGKFIGYTGTEQGIFKILLGPNELSECQKMGEKTLGNVGISSGNDGSLPISSGMDECETPSVVTDVHDILISDKDPNSSDQKY